MEQPASVAKPAAEDGRTSSDSPWAGEGLQAWLQAIALAHGDGFAVKDLSTGRYLVASPALARWLGRDVADLVGRPDADLFDSVALAALRAAEQTALAQGGELRSDHRLEVSGVRQEWCVIRQTLDVTGPGQPLMLSWWIDSTVVSRRDAQTRATLGQIEHLQRANEALRRELSEHALRDEATGLHSRAHFEDQLRREADLSSREHREFALVFIAVDNDRDPQAHGRASRALVLDALGRLVRGGTRAMDSSCRYDDSRFAVLLSGVGLATAHSRMEGLRRQCATQILVQEGRELGFTVSMGVASYPHTAQSVDELVVACAQALNEAGRRGGNHVTLASIRLLRD